MNMVERKTIFSYFISSFPTSFFIARKTGFLSVGVGFGFLRCKQKELFQHEALHIGKIYYLVTMGSFIVSPIVF